ncbi:hypothetical protein POG22_10955 [Geitlerinema sp. CS-897]|nr:hypothetical protein [Geitlerinema sp. CS-897]
MKKSHSSNRLFDLDRATHRLRERKLTSNSSPPPLDRTPPSGKGSIFKLDRSVTRPRDRSRPSYTEAKSFDNNEAIEVEGNGYNQRQTQARAFDANEPIALEYSSPHFEPNYAEASSWNEDAVEPNYAEASSWNQEADEIVTEAIPFEAQSFEVDTESSEDTTPPVEAKGDRTDALTHQVEALRQEVQALNTPAPPSTDSTAEQLRQIQHEIRALGDARSQPSSDSEAFTTQLRSLRSELQALRDNREAEALSHEYWEALELEPHFQEFDRQIEETPSSSLSDAARYVPVEVVPPETPDSPAKAMEVELSDQFAEFDRMMDAEGDATSNLNAVESWSEAASFDNEMDYTWALGDEETSEPEPQLKLWNEMSSGEQNEAVESLILMQGGSHEPSSALGEGDLDYTWALGDEETSKPESQLKLWNEMSSGEQNEAVESLILMQGGSLES